MKHLWKKIAKWFGKEEVLEPVIKKPEHCYYHTRFKKSCPLCREFIA